MAMGSLFRNRASTRRASTSNVSPKLCTRPIDIKKLNDSVWEFYKPLYGDGVPPKLELLFFHGAQLVNDQETFWKNWLSQDGDVVWPTAWLTQQFPEARILFISYDSSLRKFSGQKDTYQTIENLMHDMIWSSTCKAGQRCPVIFVGHCFGGIIVKDFLIKCSEYTSIRQAQDVRVLEIKMFLKYCKAIFFYSTPNAGSRLKDGLAYREYVVGNVQKSLVDFLEILSHKTSRINNKFSILRHSQNPVWETRGIAENLKTRLRNSRTAMVVPEASARQDMDQIYWANADHFDVSKAKDNLSCNIFTGLRHLVADYYNMSQNVTPPLPFGSDNKYVPLVDSIDKVQKALENVTVCGEPGLGDLVADYYNMPQNVTPPLPFGSDNKYVPLVDSIDKVQKALENVTVCGEPGLGDLVADYYNMPQNVTPPLPFGSDNKYVPLVDSIDNVQNALENVTVCGEPGLGDLVADYYNMPQNVTLPLPFGSDNKYVPLVDSIDKVQKALENGHECHVVTICGEPGLGKTSLVKYIALQYQPHHTPQGSLEAHLSTVFPHGVIFLPCGQGGVAKLEILKQNMLHSLGCGSEAVLDDIPQERDRDYMSIPTFRRRLQFKLQNLKVLVILDDVWEQQVVKELILSLDEAPFVKYLLTSQIVNIWPDATAVTIMMKTPTLEEARQILLKYTKGLSTTNFPKNMEGVADSLIEHANYHPLVLANLGLGFRQQEGQEPEAWRRIRDAWEHELPIEESYKPLIYGRGYPLALVKTMTRIIEVSLEDHAKDLLFLISALSDSFLGSRVPETALKYLYKCANFGKMSGYRSAITHLQNSSLVDCYSSNGGYGTDLVIHRLRALSIRSQFPSQVQVVSRRALQPVREMDDRHIAQMTPVGGLMRQALHSHRGIYNFGPVQSASPESDYITVAMDTRERTEIIRREERHTLLAKFASEDVRHDNVESWIQLNWGAGQIKEMYRLEQGTYLISFDLPEAVDTILRRGPWLYNSQYIQIARWKTNLDMEQPAFEELPIWVELPGLPREARGIKTLTAIFQGLGPLLNHSVVEHASRRTPMACIMWRPGLSTPQTVHLTDDTGNTLYAQKVMWRGLPGSCRRCKCWGHSECDCTAQEVWSTRLSTCYLSEEEMRMGRDDDKHTRFQGARTGSRPTTSVAPFGDYRQAKEIRPMGQGQGSYQWRKSYREARYGNPPGERARLQRPLWR